ncbi:type I-B CRISPR-associated protein Cas5b (plasmid) [Haloferax larsenii]|uniref:Type I-B CRISPR-associated protein Cas5b n=1 Tax=Haloferax larsenii TaxID=302484 RepID=A0ABY5RIS1_HALLR|nr:type I-B CRISPR-associated protein Cas5b [Haloferax larsenii]UVE52261.1 type I-B CRISPR-associated protein Cas5b [Haloferax larsenii]
MTTELDVAGRECLSFTVEGPWAHFRRIDATTEKLTYRVIPRTTVAGLLAAILGEPRDSYYDTFAPDASAMAISPVCSLETQSVPMLTLPTKSGDIKSAEGVSGKTVIDPEVIATERKRRTFEYVVDAAYRIDLVLEDRETFDRLHDFLASGRSTYTPTLGKSECLANITDVTRSTIEADGNTEAVTSTVPEEYVVPTPGTPLRLERTPAFMTADEGGRRTTGFSSYAFAPGDETLTAPGAPVMQVSDRAVCFR